jgi:hypothetical protein
MYRGRNYSSVTAYNGMIRLNQHITNLQHSVDTVCVEQLNKSGKNKVICLCVYATLLKMADLDDRNMVQSVSTHVHVVFGRIIRTVLRKTQRTLSPKMAHFTRHAQLAVLSTFSTPHGECRTQQAAVWLGWVATLRS